MKESKEFKPITSQEDLNEIIKTRLDRQKTAITTKYETAIKEMRESFDKQLNELMNDKSIENDKRIESANLELEKVTHDRDELIAEKEKRNHDDNISAILSEFKLPENARTLIDCESLEDARTKADALSQLRNHREPVSVVAPGESIVTDSKDKDNPFASDMREMMNELFGYT